MSVDTSNTAPKASWADEVEEEGFSSKTFTDENGIKTVVEFRINDDGKKVKVTRKIRLRLITEHVNKAMAERKRWSKFGDEQGKKPGLDMSTTTIGENVHLKLSAGTKHIEVAKETGDVALKEQLKGKRILCRLCKGDHFTLKCPYKDTLAPLEDILEGSKDSGIASPSDRPTSPEPTVGAGGGGGGGGGSGGSKYIAPHLRSKGTSGAKEGSSESSYAKRDDTATLRVSNLSEDVTESDVHELFHSFGQIARVYLARDKETSLCKGFAFVSFLNKEDAAKAQLAIDGYGYDNLILSVQPAQSK